MKKDWTKASCRVKYTPSDVYEDEFDMRRMVEGLPEQLKIVGFRIPGMYEHYINRDGYLIENSGHLDIPYFIIELNPNAEGKVICAWGRI